MREKINSYMGFARKSGQLITGAETCGAEIDKGRLKLLIISEDAAENNKEKMTLKAKRAGINYRVYGERDVMSHAVGKPGSCIFGVKDENFAKVIMKEIDDKTGKEVL